MSALLVENLDFFLFLHGLALFFVGFDALFLHVRWERKHPVKYFSIWNFWNATTVWTSLVFLSFDRGEWALHFFPVSLILGSLSAMAFGSATEPTRQAARATAVTSVGIWAGLSLGALSSGVLVQWVLCALSVGYAGFLCVRSLLQIAARMGPGSVRRRVCWEAGFLGLHFAASTTCILVASEFGFLPASTKGGVGLAALFLASTLFLLGALIAQGRTHARARLEPVPSPFHQRLWLLVMSLGVLGLLLGGWGLLSFLGKHAEQEQVRYGELLARLQGTVREDALPGDAEALVFSMPDRIACRGGHVLTLPVTFSSFQSDDLSCLPRRSMQILFADLKRSFVIRVPFEGGRSLVTMLPARDYSLARLAGMGITLASILVLMAFLLTVYAMALAKATAGSASRMRFEYLANISHEIRTPINSIMGALELLWCTELNGRQRRNVSLARTSSESLLQIVNDVLDFSRIEEGRLEVEVRDFELRAVVERVCDSLAKAAAEKSLELTWMVDGDVPELLRGDPVRLGQVLTNLVGNAVKYTESGSVFVSVARISEAEGNVRLRFMVRDTGIGIPHESIPKLFQRFSQVRFNNAIRVSGSGLGLAISRYLVERMKGELGVDSSLGKGSTFWFTSAFESHPENPPWLARLGRPLRGRRLLLVAGSSAHRLMLMREADELGARVMTAATLEEARLRVRSEFFSVDAALVDGNVAAGGWEELQHELRVMCGNPELRVILLTSPLLGSGEEPRIPTLVMPVGFRQLRDLCLELEDNAASLGERRSEGVMSVSGEASSPLRVLVVEDNRVLQEVTLSQLEMLGCHADVAPDGEHALRVLEQRQYDVVLMDLRMPGIDGIEATKRIRMRESAQGGHQVIVAMTASALKGDRELCLDAGMDDYISKPVVLEELARVLIHRGQPLG